MALNRWTELVLLASARSAMGVQFQTVGALGPVLVGGLVADYTALGTLIGAYLLPGIVIALPAGWLMARMGDRRMVLVGLALMALGSLAFAAATGFAAALAARVLAGAGAALLSIACAKMVLDRFQGGALAPAMGIMLSAWPTGIALALVLLPSFSAEGLWRWGVVASAVLALLFLGLLARVLPPDPPRPAGSPWPTTGLRRGEWAPLIASGTLWATYNAAFAVALGFSPAFLVAQGLSPAEAGAAASLIGWLILPLLPLGGWLAERLGRPIGMMLCCMLGMAGALGMAAAGMAPAFALALFGLLAGPPASLIMALAGRALSPGSRAFGMGVYYTLFYAGMAVLPGVAGWTRDATGSPAAPLVAGIGFLAAALLSLGAYQLVARRGAAPG